MRKNLQGSVEEGDRQRQLPRKLQWVGRKGKVEDRNGDI